jgi:peptidyl-prolyl cis-trans isomerase C
MSAAAGGCGSGSCSCGSGNGGHGGHDPAAPVERPIPLVNGIALAESGEHVDEDQLRERAWTELLRQEAVRRGLLARIGVLEAPQLGVGDQQVIEAMLDEDVPRGAPDAQECARYYEANKRRFVDGSRAQLRHILFAVTEGVDVERLAARAEETLRELMRKDAPADLFARRAGELSNCPSGAQGGELGWVSPHDCAQELAAALFLQEAPQQTLGLYPRLVHSRYGLHIVEVRERDSGTQLGFEQVHERIAMELAQRSRATALHQYIRVLAGRASIEGLELEAADTPLVQ